MLVYVDENIKDNYRRAARPQVDQSKVALRRRQKREAAFE
jgi:hypothetical protein